MVTRKCWRGPAQRRLPWAAIRFDLGAGNRVALRRRRLRLRAVQQSVSIHDYTKHRTIEVELLTTQHLALAHTMIPVVKTTLRV